jgi:hypothetical protein
MEINAPILEATMGMEFGLIAVETIQTLGTGGTLQMLEMVNFSSDIAIRVDVLNRRIETLEVEFKPLLAMRVMPI